MTSTLKKWYHNLEAVCQNSSTS